MLHLVLNPGPILIHDEQQVRVTLPVHAHVKERGFTPRTMVRYKKDSNIGYVCYCCVIKEGRSTILQYITATVQDYSHLSKNSRASALQQLGEYKGILDSLSVVIHT